MAFLLKTPRQERHNFLGAMPPAAGAPAPGGAASSPRSPPKNRITGLDSIAINEVMDCYKIILSSFARPALKISV